MHPSRRLSASALALFLAASAQAASFTWDPNATPLAPTGGTGTWSTANANWSNGSTDVVWTNGADGTTNDAVISGSSALTLGSAVAVRNITNTGTTTISGGTLTLDSGTSTNTGSGNAGPILIGGTSLTISSVIAGDRGLAVNGGTVTLSGANTYTGNTLVSNGTLKIGANDALTTSTSLITFGAGRTFDLNGFNQTVASISGSNGIIRNTGASPSTFTINGTASTSSGQQITGAINVVKQGTSTLSLSGSQGALNYTGTTTLSGGTLRLTSASSGLTGTTGIALDGGALASVVAGNVSLGTGHVAMSSGSITPGEAGIASTFTLAANKNFTATGGTLNFDVGTGFDQILGSGTGTFGLTNTTLSLTLGTGFAYTSAYELFNGFSSGSVSGLTITGYDTANWLASLSGAGVLSFTANTIPEPATGALIVGFAFLGFATSGRRRRA